MIWKEEVQAIDQLLQKVLNLSFEVERTMNQMESRKQTLENQIKRLESDYAGILARNDLAKKDYLRSTELDRQQLESARMRVVEKEALLTKKEKEMNRLKTELETNLSSLKTAKQDLQALGGTHGK